MLQDLRHSDEDLQTDFNIQFLRARPGYMPCCRKTKTLSQARLDEHRRYRWTRHTLEMKNKLQFKKKNWKQFT